MGRPRLSTHLSCHPPLPTDLIKKPKSATRRHLEQAPQVSVTMRLRPASSGTSFAAGRGPINGPAALVNAPFLPPSTPHRLDKKTKIGNPSASRASASGKCDHASQTGILRNQFQPAADAHCYFGVFHIKKSIERIHLSAAIAESQKWQPRAVC